jgi:hypothetical protein
MKIIARKKFMCTQNVSFKRHKLIIWQSKGFALNFVLTVQIRTKDSLLNIMCVKNDHTSHMNISSKAVMQSSFSITSLSNDNIDRKIQRIKTSSIWHAQLQAFAKNIGANSLSESFE